MKGIKRLLNLVLVLTLVMTTISTVVVTADLAPKEYDPATSLLYDDFTTGFGNGTGKYTDMTNFKSDTDGPFVTTKYGTIAKSVCLDQFADGTLTYYNENFGNALFSMIVRFNSSYTSSDSFNWIFSEPKVRWRDNALARDGKRYEIYAGPDLAHLNRVTVTDFTYYTEMTGSNGGKDLFIEYEIESLPADTKYVKVVFRKAEYKDRNAALAGTGQTDWGAVKDLWLDPSNEKAARIVITDDKSKKTTKPVLTSDNFTTGTDKMFSYLEVAPFGISDTLGVYEANVNGLTMGRKSDSKWDFTTRLCAYRIDNPLTATFSMDTYYWPMGDNGGTMYHWQTYALDKNAPEGHAAQLAALVADRKLQVWESADGMTFTQCNNISVDMYPSNTWNWIGPYHKAVLNVTGFKADTKFVQIVSPDYKNTEVRKADPCVGEVRLTHSGPTNPSLSIESGVVTVSNAPASSVLIIASYNGTKLVDAKSISDVSSSYTIANEISIEGATQIKAFLWDNTVDITPLCEAAES